MVDYCDAENSLSNPIIFPSQNRNFSTVRHPHFDMLVVSVQSTGKPDAQPAFVPISASHRERVILTGTLSKLTPRFANFTGVAERNFDMLVVRVKPEHTRTHLETETLQEKQPNTGTNLVDVSRVLLRIVAHLDKTQYTDRKSTEVVVQQADVLEHADLSDPASDESTSQG
jgi:hypothetical protein